MEPYRSMDTWQTFQVNERKKCQKERDEEIVCISKWLMLIVKAGIRNIPFAVAVDYMHAFGLMSTLYSSARQAAQQTADRLEFLRLLAVY